MRPRAGLALAASALAIGLCFGPGPAQAGVYIAPETTAEEAGSCFVVFSTWVVYSQGEHQAAPANYEASAQAFWDFGHQHDEAFQQRLTAAAKARVDESQAWVDAHSYADMLNWISTLVPDCATHVFSDGRD